MVRPRGARGRLSDRAGAAILAGAGLIAATCFFVPFLSAAWSVAVGALRASRLPESAPGLGAGTGRLLVSSLGWALLIALASSVFGCGAAWTMWRRGPVARAALVSPLLMPPALAFAGWGLLRAPDTWIGAALERAAQHGWHDAPIVAGRALAVVGLALWAFPIGAIVIWNGLRTTEPAFIEALRIDGGGRLIVARETFRLVAADIGRGALLTSLVMLGSVVPLHLAQIETLAVQTWFALDNLGVDQQWRARVGAWPLVAIAFFAGWWLGGRSADYDPGADHGGGTAGDARDVLPGGVPWSFAVLGPLALFAANLGQAGILGRFWEVNGAAISTSLFTAGGVAIGTAILGLGAARASSIRGSRLAFATRTTSRLGIACALVPGVLVGSAFASLVSVVGSSWLDRSLLPVIGAHLARFGFLGIVVGCWTANAARRLVGDQTRMDGADVGRGWFSVVLVPALPLHAAAAAAAGILSLHEIEATVHVMPPGDCLSRVILGDLHYSRIADMSAAGLWLLVVGLLPAGVAAGWQAWRVRRDRVNVNPFSSQQVP